MEYDQEVQALMKRVEQFNALELPGQPMMMHMGTMYLVNDLMRAVKKFAEEAKRRDHTVRT